MISSLNISDLQIEMRGFFCVYHPFLENLTIKNTSYQYLNIMFDWEAN